MDSLKIRNWSKWQSYRSDRGQPPWIKIHRQVMRNIEWVSLSDAERGQLVAMWLLAADHDGVIPASPEMIQKLCFMSKLPDINKFTDLGFIENGWRQHGVNMTSSGSQHDSPETEKNREEKNISSSSEPDEVGEFYLTRKKRKLKEKRLETFNRFWKAFSYPKGKAEAADAWLDIPSLTNTLVEEIIEAATKEAKKRHEILKAGKTPKMAQGWITGKRWEDGIEIKPKPEYEILD